MSMVDLALRVEALDGPDREIDGLIWAHLKSDVPYIVGNKPGRFPQEPIYGIAADVMHALPNKDGADYIGAPAFTKSLDAAMTLVPERWKLRQINFSAPCADDRRWHLSLHGGREGQDTFVGRGATQVLALTAAALRASITAAAGEGG